ncbi:MAG: FHA domain-containing protein [Proteobacteria bacterium]|nr:FHA domain-containing protein [Pseudomonadota bacterium]
MAKKFNLKIIEGNDVGTIFEMEEGVRYEIRRTPVGAIPSSIERKKTIFLNDPEISKLHAAILVVAGELVIQDMGSSNGTLVNNKRIKKSLLVNNDRIKIGMTLLMVHVITDNVADAMTFVGKISSKYSKQTYDFKKLAKILDEKIIFQPAIKMDSPFDVDSKNGRLFLEAAEVVFDNKKSKKEEEETMPEVISGYMFQVHIMNGPLEGGKFRFYRKSIIIGKTKDLWLPDTSASREHAEISVYGNGVFKIKDLGSQNGTFINDLRIQMATFKETDVIKIGETNLSFSYIPEDF